MRGWETLFVHRANQLFLLVYVDDFLLQTLPGELRNGLLAALGNVWKLEKEITLSATQPLTFLGLDMELQKNGDIFLHQKQFVASILEKYSMQGCKGSKNVQIDKLPMS